jgi:hypothetical protein
MLVLIWGPGKANYFCDCGWTAQISLNCFRKLAFARTQLEDNEGERTAALPLGRYDDDEVIIGKLLIAAGSIEARYCQSTST